MVLPAIAANAVTTERTTSSLALARQRPAIGRLRADRPVVWRIVGVIRGSIPGSLD
jgi:hypothetical protein